MALSIDGNVAQFSSNKKFNKKKSRRNSSKKEKNFLEPEKKKESFMFMNKEIEHNNEQDDLSPVNIYDQDVLTVLKKNTHLKIRIYLLRGLNLTAQSNVNSAMNKLAGYSAYSSANPYPEISIGDCCNDSSSGIVKSIKDSQHYIQNTLNPNFYRFYELDSLLPIDWKLIVSLYDYSFLGNRLIGQTQIDIEDRFYSDITRCAKKIHNEYK